MEWPRGLFGESTGNGGHAVTTPAGLTLMPPRRSPPGPPRQPPRVGAVRAAAPGRAPADRRRSDVSLRPGKDGVRGRPVRHRADARHVPGTDRVGPDAASRFTSPAATGRRAISAGRHHDRLRLADRPGGVRRPRRVRRRDDGPVPAPARRRRLHAATDLRAWDTLWGAGTGAHRGREQLRDRHRRVDPPRRARRSAPTDCSRSAIRATTAARRSTRGSASSRRDLDRLRHAFEIDDYPVSGLLTGEFHLTGDTSGRSASAA